MRALDGLDLNGWHGDAALTATALLFCVGGLALWRVAAARRGRPLHRSPLRDLKTRLPHWKYRHFEEIARTVLEDARNAMEDAETGAASTARSLLPLVAETRKQGEILLGKSGILAAFIARVHYSRLNPLVEHLERTEKELKALPRSTLTLDDVLQGRFE